MPAKLTARQARKFGIAGKSKYGNRKTTVDGITFDSKKEAERYVVLREMSIKGEIRQFELQPEFQLYVNGIHVCRYRADFSYWKDGVAVVEDVKGMKTAIYRLKKKLMKACMCIDIHEV